MSGPPPKPLALRLLNGNAGKSALNMDEPNVAELDLAPPSWLDEQSRAFWDELARMVINMRVAQESDRYALSMLAMCLSEVKNAYEMMNEQGRTMQFESGAQQVSPYFSIFSKAMSHAMKIMAEFGMTPAARTKVRTLAVKGEKDPFDTYMKRGSGTK